MPYREMSLCRTRRHNDFWQKFEVLGNSLFCGSFCGHVCDDHPERWNLGSQRPELPFAQGRASDLDRFAYSGLINAMATFIAGAGDGTSTSIVGSASHSTNRIRPQHTVPRPRNNLNRSSPYFRAASLRPSELLRRAAALRWIVPFLTARSSAEERRRTSSPDVFLSAAPKASLDFLESVLRACWALRLRVVRTSV